MVRDPANTSSDTLHGKVVMITGATSGLGRAAAFALARLGARLYLVCRDGAKAESLIGEIHAQTGNAPAGPLLGDLSSQRHVRRVAEEFLATAEPLHVLLNNAGAVFGLRRQVSVDGFEMTFALNHLAYFTLTQMLLERLCRSAPARIVNVASDAYTKAKGRFDFDDFNAQRRYGFLRAYGQSKLANILFTRELARRLAGTGVTANAVSPRRQAATRFAYNTHPLAKVALRAMAPFCLTAEDGAAPSVLLCSSPALAGVTGKFFLGAEEAELTPAATSDDDARRLWQLSAELTHLGT
jgi:NAD(P)-dependent dehydrogenase (short-subunit alcohol dehydrogenase family)